MWRYSYHREAIADADWVARCNELGHEGWSLVWHERRPNFQYDCFFKRTLSNREQFHAMLNRPISAAQEAQIAELEARLRAERTAQP